MDKKVNSQGQNTGNLGTSSGVNDPFKTTGKAEKIASKVGDTIEKVGDFVGSKISKKAGQAIRNVGDKIEHSQD